MKRCKYCGSEFRDIFYKCPNCGGNELAPLCPNCGAEIDRDNYCRNCGAEIRHEKQPARRPEKKETTFWKVLLWILFLPVMLCIAIWRGRMKTPLKVLLTIPLAFFMLVAALGNSESTTAYTSVETVQRSSVSDETQPVETSSEPAEISQSQPEYTFITAPTPEISEAVPDKATNIPSTFEIYFFDVGEGDAAAVLCDGHTMLIDGGNSGSSSILYSFLSQHQIERVDYIVCTHPDADHCGGLPGALNYAKADAAICTVAEADGEAFNTFLTYLAKQNIEITVPNPGDKFSLGSAEITVLGPLTDSANSSIVLRIVYGNTAFVFTGDSEDKEEEILTSAWSGIGSNVLKIAHHGSSSSSTQKFLNAIMPEYAVISVGGNNSYGHPAQEVLQRLNAVGAKVFRTDIQGQIHCVSDGNIVSFEVEKNALLDTLDYAGGYENVLLAANEAVKAEQAAAEAKRTAVETERNAAEEAEKIRQEELAFVYLEKGSQGTDVYHLQENLIALGFLSGSADGDFGQMTENAVASFQREMGYEATGKITLEQANTLADKATNVQAQQNTPAAASSRDSYTPVGTDYIININSGIFHYPSCYSAKRMNESNKRDYYGSRDDVIAMGYRPCKNCNP